MFSCMYIMIIAEKVPLHILHPAVVCFCFLASEKGIEASAFTHTYHIISLVAFHFPSTIRYTTTLSYSYGALWQSLFLLRKTNLTVFCVLITLWPLKQKSLIMWVTSRLNNLWRVGVKIKQDEIVVHHDDDLGPERSW